MATSQACANIALVKYWGKRDITRFLPTKSSLSVTLDGLVTTTTVSKREPAADVDLVYFDDKSADRNDKNGKNVHTFLNLFRTEFKLNDFFVVKTSNNFPTSAGLASSASGFAALVSALNQLCCLNLSPEDESKLARRGSGSACRSLHGGFVKWLKGENEDGSDSYAVSIAPQNHWTDFRVLVCVVCAEQKKVSSRAGMQTSVENSPHYSEWIALSESERIAKLEKGILTKDFKLVGEVSEADCLDMHKIMQETTPPLMYWNDGTRKVMEVVNRIREEKGPIAFFTIDAGPNVKIICEEKDVEHIRSSVSAIDEVSNIVECKVGGKAGKQ